MKATQFGADLQLMRAKIGVSLMSLSRNIIRIYLEPSSEIESEFYIDQGVVKGEEFYFRCCDFYFA